MSSVRWAAAAAALLLVMGCDRGPERAKRDAINTLDRAGLERFVRYCARGPLALERLHAPAGIGTLSSPEARLVYRLPEPDVHGRQALRLTPLELLDRLARLVPPPRIHRHRYHGVLAPNARLRSTVVSMGRPLPDEFSVDAEPPPSPDPASHSVASPGHAQKPAPTGTLAATPRSRSSRMLWAQLLARGHRREALVARCSLSCVPPAGER